MYLLAYLHIYLTTYFITYLLTPWSTVLLEKLTGFQLVKKFPELYGTRRFITAFNLCGGRLEANGKSDYRDTVH